MRGPFVSVTVMMIGFALRLGTSTDACPFTLRELPIPTMESCWSVTVNPGATWMVGVAMVESSPNANAPERRLSVPSMPAVKPEAPPTLTMPCMESVGSVGVESPPPVQPFAGEEMPYANAMQYTVSATPLPDGANVARAGDALPDVGEVPAPMS